MPSNKSVKQTIQVKMQQHSPKKKVVPKMSSQDSVSETISFVIKGKLTPIKPTFVTKKVGIGKKVLKMEKEMKNMCKQSHGGKKVETTSVKTDISTNSPEKKTLKKTKIQSKKPNAKVKLLPGGQDKKLIQKKVLQKIKKLKASQADAQVKKIAGKMKAVKKTSQLNKSDVSEIDSKLESKTEAMIVKQVRDLKKIPKKEIKSTVKVIPKNLKTKKESTKKNVVNKMKNKVSESLKSPQEEKSTDVTEKKEPETKSTVVEENREESSNSDDNLEELRQSLKNESSQSKTRPKEKKICDSPKTTKSKQESVRKKPKVTPKKISNNIKRAKVEDKFRKLKLYGYWNGPKRQRVASLNAIAKVHCLYENEGRITMLDNPESFSVKKEILDKSDEDDDNYKKAEDSPPPQRNLRNAPGLRGVGKHYDIHSASFSSDEQSDDEQVYVKKIVRVKKEPVKKVEEEKVQKKRKRKQNEITMDLKDMVVRKRMASLNATAILAASYSQERRGNKSPKSDTTDNTETSEEESASGNETEAKKCYEDDVKKEDKLIEVHTKPNKKVAVILNQDTDVTITGVYVNSTTRSTHHEGYCSIAGMQYRISATSHTQTAATAVATETLLQSAASGNGAQDTVSPETLPQSAGKPYKPLDALSNMRPPSDGAHHGHQGMGPPQHHVMSMSPSGVRHSCSSAFTAPHPNAYHHPGHGHHGPAPPPPPPPNLNGEPGYMHGELRHGFYSFPDKGYYQPAGPLITVPHGHGQPPLTKSTPLSEISPTTPSPLSSHLQHPAPSSNGGDSSDSEVIITSVTAGKDVQPPPAPPQTHGTASYRAYSSQYHPANVVPPPPSYSYPYSPHYYHPTPPPPPQSYAPPPPHDVCYSPGPYVHHKFSASAAAAAAYRRYLGGPAQYYHHQTGGAQPSQATTQDVYAQPSQQVVTTTPGSGSGTTYQSQNVGPLPPTTMMEPYPPTLVESYYYPGYPPGPPSSCYSHAPPPRAVPFINGAYQSCPCPMQSCPKNGLTGPLTGDSKRSNTLPKSSMPPLPPVALALPKEPTSDGPPSPARGSAGMPPPPSPAGATYQHQSTPPTKQESISPQNEVPVETKKKARVGKAMVRSNMQNTMLLMCNPIPANCVKREIESPKEKEAPTVPEKEEIALNTNNPNNINNNVNNNNNTIVNDAKIKIVEFDIQTLPEPSGEEITTPPKPLSPLPEPQNKSQPIKIEDKTTTEEQLKQEVELELPVISTVGENVKVKNMKRKLSMSLERKEETLTPSAISPPKKQRTNFNQINGSYKNLIKKNTNTVRINNGKRKLIQETKMMHKKLIQRSNALKRKRIRNKRRLNNLDKNNGHVDVVKKTKRECNESSHNNNNNNNNNAKRSCAEEAEVAKRVVAKSNGRASDESRGAKSAAAVVVDSSSENSKRGAATNVVVARSCQKLLAPAILDNLIAKNNVDRTIECVISDAVRTKKNNRRANNNNNNKVNKVVEQKSEPPVVVVVGGKKGAKGNCKGGKRRKSKCKETTGVAEVSKSLPTLKWSNGWSWEGESYEATVFLNSDETTVVRRCYPSMRHHSGDLIEVKDCVLLKAGARRNELPFVAKIAALWENPEDGEMMMSLLWYYRPEHTEQGRLAADRPDEVFASRHKDSNSVACIDDKCFVLTFNEYCRYRKRLRRLEEGIQDDITSTIPLPEPYPRSHRQPPTDTKISPEMIFFCRRVYDFRQKRIVKNPN